MHQRINITLPEETLRLMDRTLVDGNRSQFIDQAIKHFIQGRVRKRLRAELKAGAIARKAHDLAMMEEWFLLDEETWQPKDKK